MEIAREGHSGLYCMHFSNLFPPEASSPALNSGTAPGAASAGHPPHLGSLNEFSQWHILIRMSVENDICYVKGDAKVFSPTPSLASPAARGLAKDGQLPVRVTPDGIPIVPIYQKDRHCQVMIEGTYRVCDFSDQASAFRLEVHLERLERAVLGFGSGPDFENVILSCGGHKSCGWHLGVVHIMSNGEKVTPRQPFHFLLKPYHGKRCTNCLDPVYAIGYGCASCEVTQYCSRECLNTHMKQGHGLLCPYLKEKYSVRSGSVATEVSDDTRLVAWWRCLENSYYSILVDQGGTLGCAMEFTMCTLRSASEEGLQFRFITPKTEGGESGAAGASTGQNTASSSVIQPGDDEVIDFACVLFREVNRSAVLEGCPSLASACLNYLFVYSPSTEITIQSHLLFYTGFHCEELEGPMATVEEYVSFARPIHSLAVLQIEYALRSSIATEFWRRIRTARDALLSLLAVNELPKPGSCLGLDEETLHVISHQHCEALCLLVKVYVMMATRCKDDSTRWLAEAERQMRLCLNREVSRNDPQLYITYCFRLAALLQLFKDPSRSAEAMMLCQTGETLQKHLEAGDIAEYLPVPIHPSPTVGAAKAAEAESGSLGRGAPGS